VGLRHLLLLIQKVYRVLLGAHFPHRGLEALVVVHFLHDMGHVVRGFILLGYLLISKILTMLSRALQIVSSEHSFDFFEIL